LYRLELQAVIALMRLAMIELLRDNVSRDASGKCIAAPAIILGIAQMDAIHALAT